MQNNIKRIEIPLGRKCNINCFFCSEVYFMKKYNGKSMDFVEFIKILTKAYQDGYNHLTLVGGESTIENDFFKAVKLAKNLGMKVQISTNGLKFLDKQFTEKTLGMVDRVTLSVHTLDNEIYKKISGTKLADYKGILDKIIQNINESYQGNEIRINYVINKYNYKTEQMSTFVDYILENVKNLTSIVITYPDVFPGVVDENMIKDEIVVDLTVFKQQLENLQFKDEILKKIVFSNIPFCGLPEKFQQQCEDLVYSKESITKVEIESGVNYLHRDEVLPRVRLQVKMCDGCKFQKVCWGLPPHYEKFYDVSKLSKC